MKKITKLLLATDFSEDSYDAYLYALNLIRDMNVDMEILHVIPAIFEPVGLPVVDNLSMKTALGDAVMQMKTFVQKGIAELDSSEVNFHEKIQTNIEIGDPVKTIRRIVKRDGINLTIVGRRGQSNKVLNSLGSVSMSLLKDLKSDILIIPSGTKYEAIHHVGIATDSHQKDPSIAAKAKEIFQKKGITFDYVHVSKEKSTDFAKILSNQKEYISPNVKEAAVEYSPIVDENVAKSLIRFAEEREIDVLVLSNKKKTIFQQLFLKSTIKELIRISNYPMMILKGDKNHLSR